MFSTNHQHNNSPHPQVQPAYSAAMCSVLTPSYLLPSFYLPLPPFPSPLLPSSSPPPWVHPASVILSIPTFPATDTFPAPKWRCHSVSHRSRQILTHFNRNTHLVMMITIRLQGHLGLLRLLDCSSVSIYSKWNHSLILNSQI